MRKYVYYIGLATLTTLVVVASSNWFVDPYWIYGSPKIKRFNLLKPAASNNQRIFEITNVLNNPPEALIIGTSREDSGIDPINAIFKKDRAFNAAISSQPFIESREILQSLEANGTQPKQIVFGLLFETANAFGPPLPADYTSDNFDGTRKFKLLLSLSSAKESIKTVASNFAGRHETASFDGFRKPEAWTEQLLIGQHRAFTNNEKHYLVDNHFPAPGCKNSLTGNILNDRQATPMQELRQAIAIAHRMKSDMKLFIGPSHARQWETIHASGLWTQFEDWKRMVVAMAESEAVKAGATPFQLWDFSGYNSITLEDVPTEPDKTKRMRYYYESSHYTPAAGNLVLDRIFNFKSPDRTVPDDFGVLLTPQTIEAHLARIRADRERYRQTHPQDVAEIEAMAREVAKTKRCKV